MAATKRILERQDGPSILVGHSYGGAIITEAGVDPHVAALVYIAAHAPDEGETETGNGAKYPAAGRDAIQKTSDGYAYVEPGRYRAEFAGDLSDEPHGGDRRGEPLGLSIAHERGRRAHRTGGAARGRSWNGPSMRTRTSRR